jgi:hypothetical protein
VSEAFKVGDRVTWASQAGGTWRTKTGEVIEVVKRLGLPTSALREPGFWRAEVSYVVRATPDRPKGRAQNYWPRASALRPAPLDGKGSEVKP